MELSRPKELNRTFLNFLAPSPLPHPPHQKKNRNNKTFTNFITPK